MTLHPGPANRCLMSRHATLIALFVACTALPVATQERPLLPAAAAALPQTKVEAFLTAHDGLLVKDFYDVGGISGDGRVDVHAVVFTQPGSEAAQVRGLRVEVTSSEKPAQIDTSYLDVDEIEALSRGLKYMADLAATWKGLEKQEYTEVDFSTKDRFRVGFYQRRKDQGAFVSCGAAPAAQAFLDAKDLAELKLLVDDGLKMLKGK